MLRSKLTVTIRKKVHQQLQMMMDLHQLVQQLIMYQLTKDLKSLI